MTTFLGISRFVRILLVQFDAFDYDLIHSIPDVVEQLDFEN